MEGLPFCGREAERAALLGAWDDVVAGWGPRVVAILGEPGLGKTRLVQAFYEDIVARSDGDYWPRSLSLHGNNLMVNPDPDAGRTGAPPFLWWGMRLVDPRDANSAGVGLLPAAIEQHLRPQIEPFRRNVRRRNRRGEALSVGTGLARDFALDVVMDLIPFGGLAMTLGEAGMDLHRIYRADRADAAEATANDDLIDETLDDLALALAPRDGPAIPAVMLIDDAQHSLHDPGVTRLVAALMKRATAERWPLLLLVTHWEREWNAVAPGTISGVLAAHGGKTVRPLKLAPLSELEPALMAGLPGLPAEQRRIILDRVDGNPRFLNEMMLFASGARGLFTGGDTAGPLTENGLARLLARSVNLHELTSARLRDCPYEVQEAVCLATLQGVEFLQSVLERSAGQLSSDPVALGAAVGSAERPHAYVRTLDPGTAAFAQRIYFEVASQHLENCFDPDEARQALEGGVRDIARSEEFGELTPAQQRRFLALAAALFEEAERLDDRMIAASCLLRLGGIAQADNDFHTYRALARRLDRLIERTGDEVLDSDLESLRMIYRGAEWPEALGIQARVCDRMLRLTREALEEDANDWTIWMYVRSLALLGDHHLNCGRPEAAIDATYEAADLLGLWAIEERSGRELLAWTEVCDVVVRSLCLVGRDADAVEFHEMQVLVAERMLTLDPEDPDAEWIRAYALQRAGRLAWKTGQYERAAPHLADSVALYRALAEAGGMSAEFPAALANQAATLAAKDPAAAAGLRAEALVLARQLVAASDASEHRHLLAWLLYQEATTKTGTPEVAFPLAAEAAGLLAGDEDIGKLPPGQAVVIHGLAAALAVDLGRHAEALPSATRAGEAARVLVEMSPTDEAQETRLACLVQLAGIEQALGSVRGAARHLTEARAVLADFGDTRPRRVDVLERMLIRAEAAQPRLN